MLKKSHKHLVLLCAVVGALVFAPTTFADFSWTEVGGAGELPGTAQVPMGPGALTSISGAIVDSNAADMYRIYIPDPSAFSATTYEALGGSATFDTQLFLFDGAGMGVYMNDDYISAPPWHSLLPAGHAAGPLTAGVYNLAVTAYDRDPIAGGDYIWLDHGTGAWAPDGPGAGSLIDGWAGSGYSNGDYMIALTGAQAVPLPGAVLLGVLGLGLVGWLKRRLT